MTERAVKPTEQHRHRAAQIWCEPQHAHKVIDCELAESIAHALAEQPATPPRAEGGGLPRAQGTVEADGRVTVPFYEYEKVRVAYVAILEQSGMREALKAIGKVAEECVLEDAVLVPEWVAVTASAALTAHAPSGPMRERSNVETINLHNTIDAKLWAEEFNRVLVARDEHPYDPGFLIGWFANAIMAGFDEATRRATAPLEEALVDEVIYKSLRTVAGMD